MNNIFYYLLPVSFKVRYQIKHDEKMHAILENIEKKAQAGLKACKIKYPDGGCAPWIDDLTKSEIEILDIIHAIFYGEDWYIVDPISGSQCNYVLWQDIKKHIKFK